MQEIPHIRINARNNDDFGFKLGESLSEQIKSRIIKNKSAYSRRGTINFNNLVKRSKKFLPRLEREFPELVTELKGMSEGAKVPFGHLLVLNCEEEMLDFFIPHCTSIASYTTNKEIIVGHNDDWLPEYRINGMAFVEGKLKNKKFLALTYVGSLPGTSCGLNSKGMAFTVNSLDFRRFRYGIPRCFLLRELLEKDSLKDAEKLVTIPERSIAANTMIVQRNFSIEDVEALWKNSEIFHGNRWLIHTNHPLKKKEQNNLNTNKESIIRYNGVCNALSKEKNVTVKTVKNILRNHKIGVCSHINAKHPKYGVTIGSAIINPIEMWMEVCPGNPCKNKYRRYYLK